MTAVCQGTSVVGFKLGQEHTAFGAKFQERARVPQRGAAMVAMGGGTFTGGKERRKWFPADRAVFGNFDI